MKTTIWAKAVVETGAGNKCGVTCAFRDYAMKFGKLRAWCLLFGEDAAERSKKCVRAEREQRRKP